MRLLKYFVCLTALAASFTASANVHKWKNTQFETYSDKTQVQFTLVNRSNVSANYYLRINEKVFNNKIELAANQEIDLDISVKTPPSKTSEKLVCTKMVTDSPNTYEVCTKLTFKRF
ncbi:hypothetical protein VME0621_03722 [Vibrio mediterranei]|jgi:P pilus assembly chaperone PapD|uniref:Uncharacterized protein n=1 Tax=Vibrio mediterranei TaxID=689 RepID=A0A2S9ZG47_9VIBR|nr:hypothetical protein ECB94_17425 [Vibrio mediterranei]PCD86430.1 hypothetical protein COR52_21345 [Vibrio mediterranei]PRQ64757.1 hypothetical protein COR51_25910 [Vibrio mediterranei]PTC04246.1 hypothetical protein C9980_15010 [Vibrio mediterranei]SBO11586.1 hypothetical protein VME0621_03722 [Vibrio mediterranei]